MKDNHLTLLSLFLMLFAVALVLAAVVGQAAASDMPAEIDYCGSRAVGQAISRDIDAAGVVSVQTVDFQCVESGIPV